MVDRGGLQETMRTRPSLLWRRATFAGLVCTGILALLALAAVALSPARSPAIDILILAPLAVVLPWSVIGFWNAAIGFLIMRLARDPAGAVNPAARRIVGDEAITAATAILVCTRNEAPGRLVRNLEPMMAGLVAAGVADRFHVYVLSDTDDPSIAAEEEARVAALAGTWRGRILLTYRRRAGNAGFKAGNIREFCERWGAGHELAVTLDADSFITAQAILRLVRVMQSDPGLGILQGLVIGLPSASPFARVFQFGMRLGMRSYTIGGAWWQGDCGPYWGHNAVLRLEPFMAHCALPMLSGSGPLGGAILSHDQVEAVLMRRAGYDVRVLPEETLGWEENPPTLTEFLRRDLRWCQGNMQYWRLLALPGLRPVSRFQLALAILMFIGSPAWIFLLVAGTAIMALAGDPAKVIRPDTGGALFAALLVMWFAPKIATIVDVLLRPELRRGFGGTARFLVSVATEIAFFLLLAPIMWLAHVIFLGGLLLGRTAGWQGQRRDAHAISWRAALRTLWPQTALGLAALGVLALSVPAAIPYASFVAGGLALSIPFAVVTASPAFGRLLVRGGIGRLPEETGSPDAFPALALPATGPADAPARYEPA